MTILFQTDIQEQMEVLEYIVADISSVKGGVRLATYRALRKTIRGSRTDASRLIREEFAAKDKDVKATMSVREPSLTNIRAELRLHGYASLPLKAYNPRPSLPGRRPKGGVSVLVKRGSGRKPITGAFMARMPSGHVGVFRREHMESRSTAGVLGSVAGWAWMPGHGRLPIKELFGPSFLAHMERDDVDDRFTDTVHDRLWANLEHEAEYILSKEGLR